MHQPPTGNSGANNSFFSALVYQILLEQADTGFSPAVHKTADCSEPVQFEMCQSPGTSHRGEKAKKLLVLPCALALSPPVGVFVAQTVVTNDWCIARAFRLWYLYAISEDCQRHSQV